MEKSGFAYGAVYAATGRLVKVLVDGMKPAGNHCAIWKTGATPAGIYSVRFQTGAVSSVRRVAVIK
jgi:hypothetical protein